MNEAILTDPQVIPTNDVISAHLGRSYPAYVALLKLLSEEVPNCDAQWRFYNDGKRWLMKGMLKSKTLFWGSVGKGVFRTTFFLSAKLEAAVQKSDLPATLKKSYEATSGKSFRSITLEVKSLKDLKTFEKLLELKK